MRERRSSSRKRRTWSGLALMGRASMLLRGIITSPSTSLSNCRAREAISLACSCRAPVSAASSTICWISSLEMRASRKVVRSRKGLRITFELTVMNQTTGRASQDSASSGLAIRRA
jgi:hypothetical protein